ncbi:unnamed protein product [Thelazia callipaeda]|uniref:BESS domain-containing protein n=1 Tax=Thelazia callipaeda TaxID=103827 RepID=A0A0N5CV12_THECL|nr:unnamed protein product [Thelazia callipaeda]
MPAKVHCGGLFLGDTIQEKTRTLLGWNNEQHYPPIMVDTMTRNQINTCNRRMLHANYSRHHPYNTPNERLRHSSISSNSNCSSSSSSEYSQPSPSYSIASYESLSPEPLVSPCIGSECQSPHSVPLCSAAMPTAASISYRSPEREAQVFERLRQLIPLLPFNKTAYQVLIETVSQVMDLEQQLEQLNDKTNNTKNNSRTEQNLVSEAENSVFPDDLKTVDVTAFRRLLCSDYSSSSDTLRSVHINYMS